MPLPKGNSSSPNAVPSHGLLIALIILCAVGFLVLYFKVDLEATLNAQAVATVSQQVARVESRVAMDEQKMGTQSQSAPSTIPAPAPIATQQPTSRAPLSQYLSISSDSKTATLDAKTKNALVAAFTRSLLLSETGVSLAYTILSDTNWNDGKDHKFYIQVVSSDASGASAPTYYGPYTDNIAALSLQN